MGGAKVLVLGGYGESGRRIAHYLLESSDCTVLLAGRDPARAQELADHFNERYQLWRAEPLELDIRQPSRFLAALSGVSAVVQAGPAQPPEVLRPLGEATLKSGAHWLDLQFDPSQHATLRPLDDRARGAGVTFAVQAGFHPGLPATLVLWAAEQLEELTVGVVHSYLNPRGGLPSSAGAEELMEMLREFRPRIYKGGAWKTVTGARLADYTRVRWAFGKGRSTTVPLELEEMAALPERLPSLKTSYFTIGSSDLVTNWIVTPLLMAGMKLLPFVPLRSWGRMYLGSTRLFARPPWGTVLQLEAEGRSGGEERRLRLALLHEDAYDLTAIPAVATLLQLLEGSVQAPGVHLAAHLPNPERQLRLLRAMGVELELEGAELPPERADDLPVLLGGAEASRQDGPLSDPPEADWSPPGGAAKPGAEGPAVPSAHHRDGDGAPSEAHSRGHTPPGEPRPAAFAEGVRPYTPDSAPTGRAAPPPEEPRGEAPAGPPTAAAPPTPSAAPPPPASPSGETDERSGAGTSWNGLRIGFAEEEREGPAPDEAHPSGEAEENGSHAETGPGSGGEGEDGDDNGGPDDDPDPPRFLRVD